MTKTLQSFALCAFPLVGTLLAGAEPEFFTPPADRDGLAGGGAGDATLPKVLILGDSISIGYTNPVREMLAKTANVQRAKANCGDTNRGLKSLDSWLGETKWDVIHFNWGLHDLCYRHPESKVQGNRDKANGSIAVPLPEYEKNLEELVKRLKATGATLIWASTTPVPEGEAGRVMGDDLKYNAAAAAIMNRHGIAINDLHAVAAEFPPALWAGKGNVHFQKAGSEKLARQVSEAIKAALARSPSAP